MKAGGELIRWNDYVALYSFDNKGPGLLKVCPKITWSHVNPSQTEKMRVKYAAQVFSNSVADGLRYLQEKEVQGFQQCDGTIRFTKLANDMFDVLNRKLPYEGVRLGSQDFAVLEGVFHFLDSWEKEVADGKISKDMFLTKSTSEGLRVTLHSTIGLCRYLLSECGFSYVLTNKFNQDPLERFFGTIRQAGVQNDHPTMTTFLQLYRLLSVQKLIKPPKYSNCEITKGEEKPCLTVEDIKSIFTSSETPEAKIGNLTAKLDRLIKTDLWECEDIFPQAEDDHAIIDCICGWICGPKISPKV